MSDAAAYPYPSLISQVSVIIPTRNRPALLRAALQSVLAQTRPVDQIVVIDDASDSTDWLPAIASQSPLIEIVRRDRNGGVSAARNDGLDRAHGDFLLFLDDDDLIDPRFIEDGLAALAIHRDADGVFFGYQIVGSHVPPDARQTHLPVAESDAQQRLPLAGGDGENTAPPTILKQRPITAFLRCYVPIHSGFIRRSAVGSARFPITLKQGEDTYFWISLAAAGSRFVCSEPAYAVVRRHAGNTTRSRIRYIREIPPFYEKLLADGLLSASDDVFLAHLRLLWLKALKGGRGTGPHLRHVVSSPFLLASDFRFQTSSLVARLWRCCRELAR